MTKKIHSSEEMWSKYLFLLRMYFLNIFFCPQETNLNALTLFSPYLNSSWNISLFSSLISFYVKI